MLTPSPFNTTKKNQTRLMYYNSCYDIEQETTVH